MEWRKIASYPNYSVSDNGDVRNDRTGKVLTPWELNSGYLVVRLGGKTLLIHRLVAEAFIPNPDGKETVDHVNQTRKDNRAENLRWATRLEQLLNSKGSQPIKIRVDKGGETWYFNSQKECARELSIDIRKIGDCLAGRRKSHKGYTFRKVD